MAALMLAATVAGTSIARAGTSGEGASKSMRAVRTATPPLIDGHLGDPAWTAAPVDDRFTQHQPDEGQQPTQRTEVRVLYDNEAIYIGLRMHDRDPGGIVARMTRRDRRIETDWIAIGVDPRHDHNTGMTFRLSAAGVQQDTWDYDDFKDTEEWDGVWSSAVTRDAGGWSAEMRLPLGLFRFPAPATEATPMVWGIQVKRYISRRKETDQWAFRPTTVRGYISRFGHLDGLVGLRPRRTFELRPFIVGRLLGETESGGSLLGNLSSRSSRTEGDVGADLKLGLGRDLTLDATVNPDFGQVEADQVVLNLTRFENFFPEKRPFFLEGSDIFEAPMRLFYSRRISRPLGETAEGDVVVEPATGQDVTVTHVTGNVPILAAAKLTGRPVRQLTTGLLAALTDEERAHITTADDRRRSLRLSPRRAHTVARVRLSPGGASYVGAIATAQSRLGEDAYRAANDHDGYAQALDGQWQSPDGVWRVTSMAAASERVGGPALMTRDGRACPDPSDPVTADCVALTRSDGTRMKPGTTGWGGLTLLTMSDQHALLDAGYVVESPTFFVDDLGFLPDFNRHQFRLSPGWRNTRPWGVFRQVTLRAEASHGRDFSGTQLYIRNSVSGNVTFLNFWTARLMLGSSWSGQWDINETQDGAIFERPHGAIINAGMGTDSRRAVVVSAGAVTFRDVFGGARGLSGDATIALRTWSRLELSLAPGFGWTGHQHRFYACATPAGQACTALDTDRHYDFAVLDSGFVSLTARATWAFSPRLTLQSYAQLFSSQGSWDSYEETDTTGTRPRIRLSDLQPSALTGDTDGDGIKDDDFQTTTLVMNLVARWEIQPGSTLTMVYTRNQTARPPTVGASPTFRLRGLGPGATEDVLLLKLAWFYS